jgi:hypothetical protein
MKTEELGGLMASETGTGAATVKTAPPETGPVVAEIVVIPGARLVAYPEEFTVARPGADEVQVTDWVMFCVEPSL